MNDLNFINDLFLQIFEVMKNGLIDLDSERDDIQIILNGSDWKRAPSIVLGLGNIYRNGETLDKNEKIWSINIDAFVVVNELDELKRQKISTELQEYVFKVLFNEYGFDFEQNQIVEDLEINTCGSVMKFTCMYDIEKQIIYRK
ncbi:hypothetical protein G7062_06460 [Erysipelothrix sp. HDW6C]|uniref:hypothetical protein n=1 Tax=Erysipelothrix sp. HDW6C TaxID=2714930 RepID=UPI001409E1CB|nr:hypothetical protein [Erysipelothrix sp. HDW6C]QIK69950.1 hypothetical protein G7062_06460 [Erysipelothrix sp. HDW6C]